MAQRASTLGTASTPAPYPDALKERQPPNGFSSSSPNLEVPHSRPSSTLKHSFLFLRERLRSFSFVAFLPSGHPGVPWKWKDWQQPAYFSSNAQRLRGRPHRGDSLRLRQIQKDGAVKAPLLPSLGPLGVHSWVFVLFLATEPVSPRVKSWGLFSGFAPLFSGMALVPGPQHPHLVIRWVTLRWS